jgi:CheY-like chemotaxis protein
MEVTRPSVLVVDSHLDTLSMLTRLLRKYDTDAATSVSEAMSAVERKHYDLLLTENRLPDESGLSLCSKLRKLEPETDVIFFAAAAYAVDKENGLRAGALDYISKPDVEGLLAAIDKAVESREMLC